MAFMSDFNYAVLVVLALFTISRSMGYAACWCGTFVLFLVTSFSRLLGHSMKVLFFVRELLLTLPVRLLNLSLLHYFHFIEVLLVFKFG